MQHLLSPLRVGPFELKNRLVVGCHQTQFGPVDGLPGAAFASYMERRARGGPGLIVAEGGAPLLNAQRNRAVFRAHGDDVAPTWRPITARIRAHGIPLFGQILHGGRQATADLDYPEPLWGPSDVPCTAWAGATKAMTRREMAIFIAANVTSAQNLIAGGFQGIELHSCHGYLLSSFLSPRVNKRTDAYGGSIENRMRLLRETVSAMRDAMGRDVALGVRLESYEYQADGLMVDDACEVARQLDLDGQIDYISVSQGTHETSQYVRAPMSMAKGFAVDLTAKLKAVSKTPVFAVGKVIDPELADQTIAEGKADAIVMTREIVCEPDYALKLSTGRRREIRPCIACNHCVAEITAVRPIRCVYNPEISREDRPPVADGGGARATVVGGGPAGLEAARTLLVRGYEVTLYEAEEALGGQLRLAAEVRSRGDFQRMIEWYAAEIARLGGSIKLGTRLEAVPDGEVVVAATGARFKDDATRSALAGDLTGKRVAIVERYKEAVGLTLAELALQRGASHVSIITHFPVPALDLDRATRGLWLSDLGKRGVDFVTLASLRSRDGGGHAIVNNLSQRATDATFDAVLATDRTPHVPTLRGAPSQMIWVGDCEAPRTALFATNDAYLLCRDLGREAAGRTVGHA